MLNLKILIKMFHPTSIKRLLSVFLAFAIIPIMDCILIIELARVLGEFLFLAILVFLSLGGFILSVKIAVKISNGINEDLKNNTFSLSHYNAFPGSLSAAFLLIMPGIISSLIGLFCSIPYIRITWGAKISEFLRLDWREIHEYMSIID